VTTEAGHTGTTTRPTAAGATTATANPAPATTGAAVTSGAVTSGAATSGAAGTGPSASAKGARQHLHFVDLIRVLTVGLVVAVHALAYAPVTPTVAIGAVTVVLHVSREVFFLLTAFVLTYGTGSRPVRWPAFWRRRCLFVLAPYLTWSLVYFLANGDPWGALGRELLTGTARYHLYFLLVSLQIYLTFPLVRWLIRVTRGHHGALLAAGAAFQLLFSLAVQQHWTLGALTGWLRAPDALLPSYLGYVVAGALAAWHREELVGWTRRHVGRVLTGGVAAVGLGVGVYLMQVGWGGQDPLTAATVFQPVVVVESVGVAWLFLLAALRWEERGRPARRLVRAGSDASFGVYLGHPLLLQATLAVGAVTGGTALAQRLPGAVVLLVTLGLVAPALYLASGLLTVAARRSPVSLPLTGRTRQRHAAPVAAPRPAMSLDVQPATVGGP
jgi:peptidoglycan/LPS O-acetylase OafA/YrhL